jgi:hypothetical protein
MSEMSASRIDQQQVYDSRDLSGIRIVATIEVRCITSADNEINNQGGIDPWFSAGRLEAA